MSKHVTYRGVTVDMDSLRRENEKVTAIGNMKVNARGDQIKGGTVTKTADQIARENHRVQTVVVNSGLKGKLPKSPEISMNASNDQKAAGKEPVKPTKSKGREVELPSGDIIIEGDTNES